MREIIQNLNKSSLAKATGISYSRLRKYAAGALSSLTVEEKKKIKDYLLDAARAFE